MMEPMSEPRPRRFTAALAALALAAAAALAACSPGGAPGAGGTGGTGTGEPRTGGDGAGTAAIVPGSSSTLRWHPCTGQLAGTHLLCGTLRVPVDYANPGGRQLTLALSMLKATAPRDKQQGVLLVNPGGPGMPGRSFATDVAQGMPDQVAATYDIVGFDTRATGASVPALSCDPAFFGGDRPDYIPANAAAERVLIARAKAYAAGCERRFGWLLPQVTSVNMARDMDAIRAAFGVQKINYVGYSAGTYLGQVYGTLFPGRVRRMVLDSTVDPTGIWYRDNIAQDYAFQQRLDAFYAWIAKYDASFHLGGTAAQVRAKFYQARDTLKRVPVTGPGGQPLIGPAEFDDTFIFAGYYEWTWPGLAWALVNYLNGSSNSLLSQYQLLAAQPENGFAVYTAVQCNDAAWPRNWAQWQADATRIYRTAPFQAWDNTWFNAACAFWPVKAPAKPFQVNGAKLPPILMLQGTQDAATPYAGAQNAHKLLPTARMVVVAGGGTHGQTLQIPPNNCVNRYFDDYLAHGAVPTAPGLVNATCPATAPPTPTS
jgi:pimeloyl-ACP methyl ester carboxylesterase